MCACVYPCFCVQVCAHEYRFLSSPEEGVESLGAEITGECELPDVGAGNQARVIARAVSALNG